MGRENKRVGQIGEGIALVLLEQKGYKILGANVRTPLGEIDVVARQKETTVFIEVKTRATPIGGGDLHDALAAYRQFESNFQRSQQGLALLDDFTANKPAATIGGRLAEMARRGR